MHRRKLVHSQSEHVKSNVLHRVQGSVLASDRTPNLLDIPDDEVISLPEDRKSKSEKTPQIGVTEGDSFGMLAQVSPTIHRRSSSIASTKEDDEINVNPNTMNTILNNSNNSEPGPILNIDFVGLASPSHPTIESSLAPALELPIHAEEEAYDQIITSVNDKCDVEIDISSTEISSSCSTHNTTHNAGAIPQYESKSKPVTSIQSSLMQSQTRLEAGTHPNIYGTSTIRAKSRERFAPGHQLAGRDRNTRTDPTAKFHQMSSTTSATRVTKSRGLANPVKAITWPQRPTLNEALALVQWVVEKEKEKEDASQARLLLAAQQELECLKGVKEDLVKEIDGRQKTNAELQAKLNDDERRIKEYEEKIGGLKKFSKGLENDLGAEKSRYEDLQKELTGKIEHGNKLATDRENLRLQIHELEGKIESMQQRLAVGQEAQGKVTELEMEKDQLVAQIKEKDIILSEEKAHVSRLEEQLALQMQNAESFKNCITDLQETISHRLGKVEASVVAQNDPERRELLRQLLDLVKDVHVRQNSTPDNVDAVRAEIENLRSR